MEHRYVTTDIQTPLVFNAQLMRRMTLMTDLALKICESRDCGEHVCKLKDLTHALSRNNMAPQLKTSATSNLIEIRSVADFAFEMCRRDILLQDLHY
jgi:hypothetical protein